jgi:hypothetical protein
VRPFYKYLTLIKAKEYLKVDELPGRAEQGEQTGSECEQFDGKEE